MAPDAPRSAQTRSRTRCSKLVLNAIELPILKALLASGADPKIKNKYRVSALDPAEDQPKLLALLNATPR